MQTEVDPTPPRRRWSARLLWPLLGWFLEHLYTDLAWGYDLVANITSIGQWWRWQEALFAELPPGKLLELGIGTGHLLARLTEMNHQIIGLDLSRQMIAISQNQLKRQQLNAPIVNGDALHLPFIDNSFSGVYATFPSDYFYKSGTLGEINRILKPEGKVILVPYAIIHGESLLDKAAGFLFRATGQSPDNFETAWLDHLQLPGFKLGYKRVEQERATVLVITLRKSLPQDRALR